MSVLGQQNVKAAKFYLGQCRWREAATGALWLCGQPALLVVKITVLIAVVALVTAIGTGRITLF